VEISKKETIMRLRALTMITTLLLVLMVLPSVAADLKVGVIDFQEIFSKYEGFAEAQSIFNKDVETWQSLKTQMIDDLMASREDLDRKRPLLTPEALSELQSEIARMEAEIYQFEQEKFGPEGEAVRRDMELSEPIYEKIREVVKSVAEEDGYDLILDITGTVLYVRPELDMSDRIQDALAARG